MFFNVVNLFQIDFDALPAGLAKVGGPEAERKEDQMQEHQERIVGQHVWFDIVSFTILHQVWPLHFHEPQVDCDDAEHLPWALVQERQMVHALCAILLPEAPVNVVESLDKALVRHFVFGMFGRS